MPPEQSVSEAEASTISDKHTCMYVYLCMHLCHLLISSCHVHLTLSADRKPVQPETLFSQYNQISKHSDMIKNEKNVQIVKLEID